MLSDAEFQQPHFDEVIPLLYPDLISEHTNALGCIPPSTQAGDSWHPGVIPSRHMHFIHQLQKLALTHHRKAEIEPGKFILMGREYFQLIDKPVVQWAMRYKFQRTDGMGDIFDGIAL